MKPTLYADDIDPTVARGGIPVRPYKFLMPILPRRCDNCGARGKGLDGHVVRDCDICDGRGYLYPETPEWWDWDWDGMAHMGNHFYRASAIEDTWQLHLQGMWRAMGIAE